MSNKHKWLAILSMALLVAQSSLVLLSWLLQAMQVQGVRSLLSGEGVRWFLGHFVSLLQTPLLIGLLLLSMAWGCLRKSGLLNAWKSPMTYGKRVALWGTLLLFIVMAGILLGLTVIPHAILLSATGQLLPSAFSAALLPIISMMVILLSTCYGLLSRNLPHFMSVWQALVGGISKAAPLFVFYVIVIQFWESLRFVWFQNPQF